MNMLHSKHYPFTSRWLRTDSNRPTWPTYYSSNPSNTWWWGRGVCFWKKEVIYYLDLGSHHMNLLPHQTINKIQLLQSRPCHNKNRTELQKSGRFVNQNIGCASVLRVATEVLCWIQAPTTKMFVLNEDLVIKHFQEAQNWVQFQELQTK